MAIAIDQVNAGTAVSDAGSTTIAVNTNQTIAAGGFIVASIGWWSATDTLSSLSGGSLSWNIAVQGKHTSDNTSAGIAWAQAPSGLASGTTITATFSGSVNGRHIGITSFTGVATSSPVDATSPLNSQTAAIWTTGSTALSAGSVLVGTSHLPTGGSSTTVSPSLEALDWTDGADTSQATGYRIEASAASYTVSGTWTTSTIIATVGAAFKEDAGGGVWPPVDNPAAPPLRIARSNLRLG